MANGLQSYHRTLTKYRTLVTNAIAKHADLSDQIRNHKRGVTLNYVLCEQHTLHLCVTIETAVSDLVALLAKSDTEKVRAGHVSKLCELLSDITGKSVRARTKAVLRSEVDRMSPSDLSPSSEGNLTFRNADALNKFAADNLAAKFASFVLVKGELAKFFDYLIGLRNLLAHRSKRSMDRFCEGMEICRSVPRLKRLFVGQAPRLSTEGAIGKYLSAGTGSSRVELLHDLVVEFLELWDIPMPNVPVTT